MTCNDRYFKLCQFYALRGVPHKHIILPHFRNFLGFAAREYSIIKNLLCTLLHSLRSYHYGHSSTDAHLKLNLDRSNNWRI